MFVVVTNSYVSVKDLTSGATFNTPGTIFCTNALSRNLPISVLKASYWGMKPRPFEDRHPPVNACAPTTAWVARKVGVRHRQPIHFLSVSG